MGGRACPLSLVPSTGLTFGNCKLQKLARAKCLTLFDLQPYGEHLPKKKAGKKNKYISKQTNKQDRNGEGRREE